MQKRIVRRPTHLWLEMLSSATVPACSHDTGSPLRFPLRSPHSSAETLILSVTVKTVCSPSFRQTHTPVVSPASHTLTVDHTPHGYRLSLHLKRKRNSTNRRSPAAVPLTGSTGGGCGHWQPPSAALLLSLPVPLFPWPASRPYTAGSAAA